VAVAVVNYHYVRPRSGRFAALNGITPDAFAAQLDLLVPAVAPQDVRDGSGYAFTFDDGLVDHVAHVAPELERRGARGFFFVSTASWEGRVLAVHKLHLLMASVDVSQLRAAVGGSVDTVQARAIYRYDDAAAAELKFLLNRVLAPEDRERVLSALFAELLGDERAAARELYLDADACRSLSDRGHVVGLHSHTHLPLVDLDDTTLRTELETNAELLRAAIGERPRTIAYPYGAFDGRVKDAARDVGMELGFTTVRGHVHAALDTLELPRIDTNDAPGGKRPAPEFALARDG